MAAPQRATRGITTAGSSETLGQFVLPDMTKVHGYFNDFDTYVAGDWTVTETGSGTRALTDVDGGVLLITNAAADNDANFFNKVGESFLVASGKKLWFKARLTVSDATQSDFLMGIQKTDTTPLTAPSDGIWFQKDDGDTALDFSVTKNATSTSGTNLYTVVAATYFTCGFYYDGVSTVTAFVNDASVGTYTPGGNLPDDEELTISFGIQNGEAVAKTMSVDYIGCWKER